MENRQEEEETMETQKQQGCEIRVQSGDGTQSNLSVGQVNKRARPASYNSTDERSVAEERKTMPPHETTMMADHRAEEAQMPLQGDTDGKSELSRRNRIVRASASSETAGIAEEGEENKPPKSPSVGASGNSQLPILPRKRQASNTPFPLSPQPANTASDHPNGLAPNAWKSTTNVRRPGTNNDSRGRGLGGPTRDVPRLRRCRSFDAKSARRGERNETVGRVADSCALGNVGGAAALHASFDASMPQVSEEDDGNRRPSFPSLASRRLEIGELSQIESDVSSPKRKRAQDRVTPTKAPQTGSLSSDTVTPRANEEKRDFGPSSSAGVLTATPNLRKSRRRQWSEGATTATVATLPTDDLSPSTVAESAPLQQIDFRLPQSSPTHASSPTGPHRSCTTAPTSWSSSSSSTSASTMTSGSNTADSHSPGTEQAFQEAGRPLPQLSPQPGLTAGGIDGRPPNSSGLGFRAASTPTPRTALTVPSTPLVFGVVSRLQARPSLGNSTVGGGGKPLLTTASTVKTASWKRTALFQRSKPSEHASPADKSASRAVSSNSVSEATSSPPETPFRFTTFPASLPRVPPTNPRLGPQTPRPAHMNSPTVGNVSQYFTPSAVGTTSSDESPCKLAPTRGGGAVATFPRRTPGTVRKRMNFSDVGGTTSGVRSQAPPSPVETLRSFRTSPLPAHQNQLETSREDDGTHNSSISSISVEITSAVRAPIPSTPAPAGGSFLTAADLKSMKKGEQQSSSSHPPALQTEAWIASPPGALLASHRTPLPTPHRDAFNTYQMHFWSDAADPRSTSGHSDGLVAVGDSRDGDAGAEATTGFSNLQAQLFPEDEEDDGIQSTTPRNVSAAEETTTSTGAFTPFQPSDEDLKGTYLPPDPTPAEVQFPPFQMDGCSPIRGDPEEVEVTENGVLPAHRTMDHTTSASSPSSGLTEMVVDKNADSDWYDVTDKSQASPQNLAGFVTELKPIRSRDGDSKTGTTGPVSESSALSISHGSSESSRFDGQQRKLRPMPDMAAFESGGSAFSSQQQKRTDIGQMSNHNSGEHSKVPVQPSPPKPLCPPTPVRTPGWARTDATRPTIPRSNSLITSKLLATCPPQVLDGLSSLENSLLEEDKGETKSSAMPSQTADETMAGSNAVGDRSFRPVRPLELDSASHPHSTLHVTAHRNKGGRTSGDGQIVSSSCDGKRLCSWPKGNGASGSVETGSSVISFENDFENLGQLGSGCFADVFKVRSKHDNGLYAVKRTKTRFRGVRDRDRAMAEVRTMQKLQKSAAPLPEEEGGAADDKARASYGLYLLFFIRAWQEDGYFFCQTELCCRDTCRELLLSLGTEWEIAKTKYPSLCHFQESSLLGTDSCHFLPESTVWKICHDVVAGLSHIHSHDIVHNDIKPSNIFLLPNSRLGALCKIGDFGLAGVAGSVEEGLEGDTMYIAGEVLSSGVKSAKTDMFSLGLTLYELATSGQVSLPTDGPRWHELRNGEHVPALPEGRSAELVSVIQNLMSRDSRTRMDAKQLLETVEKVRTAGKMVDSFLKRYILDVQEYDARRERRIATMFQDSQSRRFTPTGSVLSRLSPMTDSERVVSTPTPESSGNAKVFATPLV